MAKNLSQINIGGKWIGAVQCSQALKNMSYNFTKGITQRVQFAATQAGKECAEYLLLLAQRDCPVGTVSYNVTAQEGKSYNGRTFKEQASRFGVMVQDNKTIQFRNSKGRFRTMHRTYVVEKEMLRFKTSRTHTGVDLYRHQTGALRDSGRVVKVKNDRGKVISYEVSFDTRRTDPYSIIHNFNYAVVQHNNVNFNHKHGKARFLLDNLNENRDLFLTIIKENLVGCFSKEGIK
jgi:hypothetical protein